MTLRRLAALLTSAAMLHLSATAGAAACPPHGAAHHATTSHDEATADHGLETSGHVMAMPATAEALVTAHAPHAAAPQCESPAQQHCCDAVVGCGVDSAVTNERPIPTSNMLAATRIHESLGDTPASFEPAPEPPPPKA